MGWWKKLNGSLRKFQALTGPERKLVLEAWLEGWRAVVLLRTPWRKRLFARSKSSPGGDLGGISLERTLYLVELSSAYHLKALTCLERALTCQRMLQRRGARVELRIGVRKDTAGELEAHAWLEGPDLSAGVLTFDYEPMERVLDLPRHER